MSSAPFQSGVSINQVGFLHWEMVAWWNDERGLPRRVATIYTLTRLGARRAARPYRPDRWYTKAEWDERFPDYAFKRKEEAGPQGG